MRITLLDNLLLEQRGDAYHFDLQPHLGLISLLAVLQDEGHDGNLLDPKVEVSSGRLPLDASLYERLADDILASMPDVVGMTSLGCNFIGTAKIASHLKRRNPELPILLGGPHASILDMAVLQRFPQFDIVVRGEAELTLPPLLDRLSARAFSGLLGITYRIGEEIRRNPDAPLIADLNTLPPAAYSHYPVAELGLTSLRVEAGRGCPFACTFCSTASFFGRRYRLKSADRLCADLDRLHYAYGITHFALTHDLFTVNKAKVREFCDAVDSRGYTWSCSARMDCVDDQLLERMSDAGCRSIYYGVETGSPRMQQEVVKRLDLSLFWPTLTATRKVGIAATTSFITGYPQERADDQAMTLDMIGDLWYREPETVRIQLHLLTPEPGTGLLSQFGAELAFDGHISDFNLPTLEPDDAEIMRNDAEIFVNHHYYRSVLPRRRHILVTAVHPLLYRLGYAVQRHLLARYNASLSRFFEELLAWADSDDAGPPYSGTLLRAYMMATWGRDDYLTSLVRYMLAATDPALGYDGVHYSNLSDEGAVSAVPDAGSSELYLRCSPNVALLRDLHWCPEILALLSAAEAPETITVPRELRERRGSYVLLPVNRTRTVRNLAVTEDTVSLLTFLEQPRHRSTIAEYLGVPERDLRLLDDLLGQLVALGVLQRVQVRHARRDGADGVGVPVRAGV
jgi:radical SAM superfamily enzyme YgiQ (UPF0313 family)